MHDRQQHRPGFTLVEMMIAFALLTMVSAGIYVVLRGASNENNKTNARAAATNEATRLLKQINIDLANAASGSLQIKGDGSGFNLQIYQGDKNDRKPVQYVYNKPVLTRNWQGTSHPVSDHLDALDLSLKPGAPGQVIVKVTLAVPIPGSGEPYKLEQTALCVMREDAYAVRDPHWREVNNIDGVFNTYGDLMSSVKDDTNRIMQDIKKQIDGITQSVKDAANLGDLSLNPRDIIRQLTDSVQKVKDNLTNLDDQIAGMAEDGVLDIDYSWWARNISGKTDKMKAKARDMRAALSQMKTDGQMNWGVLQAKAGGYGGSIRGSFKDMFAAKGDLFKAQKDLESTMADVKQKFGL